MVVSISIDTEEDDWASYTTHGASVRNISHLSELQECFARWGARPTYLLNRPPLLDDSAVAILGSLRDCEGVEIGAHCHPWNTPPFGDPLKRSSMMCTYSDSENKAKIGEILRCLRDALGVTPTTFKAGRWGFGPSVARALREAAFEVDCSVTPLVDWSAETGPDYLDAPLQPYRFHPDAPFTPDARGTLVEMPVTVRFLSGNSRRREQVRRWIENSALRRLRMIGLADRAGLLARRWLSPETSSGETMARLADVSVASGDRFLHLTFHSCALLPGATPFVRDEHDRKAFLSAIDHFLRHCSASGYTFRTFAEAARAVSP